MMSGLFVILHSLVQGISLGIGFALGGRILLLLDTYLTNRRNNGGKP